MAEAPPASVAQAIRDAAEKLAKTSDTARLDAEVLMAHALGVPRSEMLVRHMADAVPSTFAMLVERRAAHEPVAYITGTQEFYGRSFIVSPDVLIPRGDSEVLVERAIAAKPDALRVFDCGTGSGALLLTCLLELPAAMGVGIDAGGARCSAWQCSRAGTWAAREPGRCRLDFAGLERPAGRSVRPRVCQPALYRNRRNHFS